jgi:hypothetical protein
MNGKNGLGELKKSLIVNSFRRLNKFLCMVWKHPFLGCVLYLLIVVYLFGVPCLLFDLWNNLLVVLLFVIPHFAILFLDFYVFCNRYSIEEYIKEESSCR